MSSVKKGPTSGQVTDAAQGTEAAERGNGGWDHPVHGAGGSPPSSRRKRPMSQLLMGANKRTYVSLEDIDIADVQGRTLVTVMLLEDEEHEEAQQAFDDMQAGVASSILGRLRKPTT